MIANFHDMPRDRRSSTFKPEDVVQLITEDEEKAIVCELEEQIIASPLPLAKVLALTCSAGGLQQVWSTIFSNGSAYLFSLGITKSQSSLIWAIAPLCGTFIQPLVGAISDGTRSRFGRRRPFILGGALGIIVSLLALAFVEDMAPWSLNGWVKAAAVLLIVLLNISIQPLQSGFRALIVDTCPPDQQVTATAWASRFAGLGNILGFFAGSLPLPGVTAGHERLRFRYLSVLSCVVLVATTAITTMFIAEKNHQQDLYDVVDDRERSLVLVWKRLLAGFQGMSPRARWICKVQFFSWMAWFGFLFYSTSYISALYLFENGLNRVQSTAAHAVGLAIGSSADLLFALVSFGTSILLPWVLDAAISRNKRATDLPKNPLSGSSRRLVVVWALSNILYSICIFSTVFINKTTPGITMVAIVGMSWAITQWVPFALISTEISSQQESRHPYHSLENDGTHWSGGVAMDSGVMLGLYNAAISLPQILAALVSSVVFWIAKETGKEDDAVGWVLRFSAVASLMAAWIIFRGTRAGSK